LFDFKGREEFYNQSEIDIHIIIRSIFFAGKNLYWKEAKIIFLPILKTVEIALLFEGPCSQKM